jgi:hypothetical protein
LKRFVSNPAIRIQPKKESCNQNEVEKPHFVTASFSLNKLLVFSA